MTGLEAGKETEKSPLCDLAVLKKYSNHWPLSSSVTSIKLSFNIQRIILLPCTHRTYIPVSLCMSLGWIFSFSTSNQWSLQQLGFDYHKGNQFQSPAASFQKHYVKLIYCLLSQQDRQVEGTRRERDISWIYVRKRQLEKPSVSMMLGISIAHVQMWEIQGPDVYRFKPSACWRYICLNKLYYLANQF